MKSVKYLVKKKKKLTHTLFGLIPLPKIKSVIYSVLCSRETQLRGGGREGNPGGLWCLQFLGSPVAKTDLVPLVPLCCSCSRCTLCLNIAQVERKRGFLFPSRISPNSSFPSVPIFPKLLIIPGAGCFFWICADYCHYLLYK